MGAELFNVRTRDLRHEDRAYYDGRWWRILHEQDWWDAKAVPEVCGAYDDEAALRLADCQHVIWQRVERDADRLVSRPRNSCAASDGSPIAPVQNEHAPHLEEVAHRPGPLTCDEFLALAIPPRRLILEPWLPEKGLAMIYSPRGMGKTILGLTCGYCIATGSEFLGFRAPVPKKVLFVDGEMPAAEMQKRLMEIRAGFDWRPPDPIYFRFFSGDLAGGLPDLGSRDGQAEFDAQVGDAEVIILDNTSTLVRSGVENDAESWDPVQAWLLAHRRAGRSIILFHHAGKSGAQRGTSKREDVLDTVIALKHPCNYSPLEGARFEIHFEKARSLYGAAAESFEALYEVRDNRGVWARRAAADTDTERVVEALASGKSIRKAADALGMSKSAVGRAKQRAAQQGLAR